MKIENPKDIEDFNKMYKELSLNIPINEITIDLKCSDSFWDTFTNRFLPKSQINYFTKDISYEKIRFKSVYLPEYGQINRV